MFGMCVVCLNCNVRKYNIENSRLQEIYEKLTSTELNRAVGVCVTICYICYSQLQRCRKFSEMAQKSHTWLTSLVDSGNEVSQETMINQNLFTKHNLSINTIPPISIYENSDGLNTQVIVKEELIEMDDSAHVEDSEIFSDCLIEHPTPAAYTVLATNVSPKQILKKTLNNESRADSRRKQAERALDVSCVKPKRYQNRVQTEETNESLVSNTSEASQLTINTSSSFITPATDINDKIDIGTHSNNQRKASRKRRNVNTKKDIKDTRPAPATNNKSITIEKEDKVDISILTDKQKKAMICETIHKLTYLIEEYKPSMIANYNLECQRVREEKKMNKDSKKRLPKKRFPWCNSSRLLLDRLIKLAGSEQAGAMILSERVLPLFPKGFARMPTLLRMAGCKNTIVPEVKRQMFDTVSPILHQAPKILPSQIISVKTPREENVTLSLPFIVNTFSLNPALIRKTSS